RQALQRGHGRIAVAVPDRVAHGAGRRTPGGPGIDRGPSGPVRRVRRRVRLQHRLQTPPGRQPHRVPKRRRTVARLIPVKEVSSPYTEGETAGSHRHGWSPMESRRTALILGGTGSLGFHAARAILAQDGWDAVITGRRRVAEAAECLGGHASGLRLDLGSLEEVRSFARALPPLDAIVCAAGLMRVSGTRFTDDGVEETFGVNHLAHFLLVREALPLMRPGSRVVFVSGAAHDPARRTGFPSPDFAAASELAHPDAERAERRVRAGLRRYAASKLCMVMTAYEFARRIPPIAVTF